LWCVAIAPDAQRGIPGGIGLGDSGAAPDVVSPRVVDLRAATPGRDNDEVIALSLAADSTTAFAGMVCGRIYVVDCDSVRVGA
jgi:hypothetical protein